MAAGWVLAIGALGCAFAGWQHVSVWTTDTRGSDAAPVHRAGTIAPWLLLLALALTGASLLTAL
jgi:hypothetical protein